MWSYHLPEVRYQKVRCPIFARSREFPCKSLSSTCRIIEGIAGKTSNPERALQNLLVRDGLFTDRLRKETERARLPAIEVDNSLTADALLDRVAKQFGLDH